MRKSNIPAHPPQGNAGKHLSYREAWERIKQGQECGFYLEAVALEESIITDRLMSHLIKSGMLEKSTASHKSFNHLIQLWRKGDPSPIRQGEFSDLQAEVDAWRKQRNLIVHGMVKSHPDEAPEDIVDFLDAAKKAAEYGAQLARAVSNWHKRKHPQKLPHRSTKSQFDRNQKLSSSE